MIQSVMLVMLGFFAAGLLAFAVAPAFFSRAERLTQERMRARMPVSEAEIRAEKDQMRAQYAVRVHQLQKQAEHAKLNAARQTIEINRRDARIEELSLDNTALTEKLSEQRNARHVLESTIQERLPSLKARLETARSAISERDQLIQQMKADSESQHNAMLELEAIVRQQKGEADQLRQVAASRSERQRRALRLPGVEVEGSLTAEVDRLRARTREQRETISRLQARVGDEASPRPEALEKGRARTPELALVTRDGAPVRDVNDLEAELRDLRVEVETLRREKGKSGGDEPEVSGEYADLRAEIDRLETSLSQAEAQLREANAQLKSTAGADAGDARALKAQLSGLQAKSDTQSEVIERLRAELTAAERRAIAAGGVRQSAIQNGQNGRVAQNERGSVAERAQAANGANGSAGQGDGEQARQPDAQVGKGVEPEQKRTNGSDKRESIRKRLAKQSEETQSASRNLLSKIRGFDRSAKP